MLTTTQIARVEQAVKAAHLERYAKFGRAKQEAAAFRLSESILKNPVGYGKANLPMAISALFHPDVRELLTYETLVEMDFTSSEVAFLSDAIRSLDRLERIDLWTFCYEMAAAMHGEEDCDYGAVLGFANIFASAWIDLPQDSDAWFQMQLIDAARAAYDESTWRSVEPLEVIIHGAQQLRKLAESL